MQPPPEDTSTELDPKYKVTYLSASEAAAQSRHEDAQEEAVAASYAFSQLEASLSGVPVSPSNAAAISRVGMTASTSGTTATTEQSKFVSLHECLIAGSRPHVSLYDSLPFLSCLWGLFNNQLPVERPQHGVPCQRRDGCQRGLCGFNKLCIESSLHVPHCSPFKRIFGLAASCILKLFGPAMCYLNLMTQWSYHLQSEQNSKGDLTGRGVCIVNDMVLTGLFLCV